MTAPPDDTEEILTPEGVPLRFTIAPAGDRAAALAVDLLVLGALLLGLLIAMGMLAAAIGLYAVIFGLLGFFLLRHFYFVGFELRWQGATPGKRWLGLRVVDRSGRVLDSQAVLARNLTREIEVWLPLVALLAPEALWPDAPPWTRLLAGAWLIVFALMPLFNRSRLRIGDLVAGTMVVRAPRAVLLDDLARAPHRAGPTYAFTPEQLDIYGIYELQVLEDLLRAPDKNRAALDLVADKIRKKVAWRGRVDSLRFLRDFYAAQRARLEHRLVLGDRRERKLAGGPEPSSRDG